MKSNTTDVIVIGAGAAGMMAALQIAEAGKKVMVVEAKQHTGGRMHTIKNKSFEKPVELGAEFIHGNLPQTFALLKEADLSWQQSEGEMWQSFNGKLEKQEEEDDDDDNALQKKMQTVKNDITVETFIEQHLANDKELAGYLKSYVQGYYAGDISKAGLAALRLELSTGQDVAYRINGGYQKLITYLEVKCREKKVLFFLEEEVIKIDYFAEPVITTTKQTLRAKKVLVTASVGVLQSGCIEFFPALTDKLEAIKKLGFGHVVKIMLQFTDPFWTNPEFTKDKDLSKMNFLFSAEAIPTWWTQYPGTEAMLVGWLGGPPATAFKEQTKEAVVDAAVESLSKIFNLPPAIIKDKLREGVWYNWSADKHFNGAYAYNVVEGEKIINSILEPSHNCLFFAGEGLHYGNEIGTVEGALLSGKKAADKIIASFS